MTPVITRKLAPLFVATAFLTSLSCSKQTQPVSDSPKPPSSAATNAFADSFDAIPVDWKGPKFKLSHDYPKTKPPCGPDQAPWLKRKVSFNDPKPKWQDWAGYVQDIIDYVQEGQDPNLPNEIGWRSQIEAKTGQKESRWYHIPWMAFPRHGGREFIHGLTNEVTADLDDISRRSDGKMPAKPGTEMFETWSVGMYNACGAYAVGQAFPESGEPQMETKDGRSFVKGLPFPEGTVVMKVLNTTADETNASFLKGSTTWQANTHVMTKPNQEYDYCARTPRTVHLIQIDLAVVDSRSPSRWVYSTLVYYYDKDGKTVFDRLHPLGVQWGSDPNSWAAVQAKNPLTESIQAPLPHAPKSVFEHYGCNGRLAGPVDNPDSSCVSCHAGAFTAYPNTDAQGKTIPNIFVKKGTCDLGPTPANKAYFSNYPYPSRYPDPAFKDAIPLDTSLQLAVAFQQYESFKTNPNPVCAVPQKKPAPSITTQETK